MATTGPVTLISSGETANSGGKVFESLAQRLRQPLNVAVLETPAGFETNAGRVAGRVADFIGTRLQNYQPAVRMIAARKKGTPLSPDNPEIVDPLYESEMIFFGPGSPTYTVRQLQDSLAWQVVQTAQRQGAALVLASAAVIAIGRYALPVYEIYKVGEDPLWKPGLDLFGAYGLPLVFVPHWNNREGGGEVDTSRCFVGRERFKTLQAQLPPETTVVGLDEHTSLTIDVDQEQCRVQGSGQVHLLRGEHATARRSGSFPITELGPYHPLSAPDQGLAQAVWQTAIQRRAQPSPVEPSTEAPAEVLRLVAARQDARQEKNFALADRLRGEILQSGWEVKDTPEGPQVFRQQE